jgi:hypothetical protein
VSDDEVSSDEGPAPGPPTPEDPEEAGSAPSDASKDPPVPVSGADEDDSPAAEPAPAPQARAGPPLEDADPDSGPLGDDEREQGSQDAFDARVDGLDTMLADGERRHSVYGDITSTGERAQINQVHHQENYYGQERSARPVITALPARYVKMMRGTYIESESYHDLLRGFGQSPLQVLVGREHNRGRATTALAAVAAHAAPPGADLTDKVHFVETRGDAESVALSGLPARSGLVLVLGEGEPVPGPVWLAQVNRTLSAPGCGSVLVVVASEAPYGQVDAGLVTYTMPPLELICEAHLRARLERGLARGIAAMAAVLNELGSYRSPEEARLLAKDLAEGYRRGLAAKVIIANRDPETQLKQIDSQLTEAPVWQRAYLVASAVLDGTSVGTVVREASRLADLVEADGETRESDRGERFTGKMRDWSEGCVELGDTAEGTGRTVRVVHQRLVPRILEEVWQEHVGMRDAMLAWLKQLAVHPEVRVRVKGAQAVAKLATYDFDVIRREILAPWAGNGGFRPRQAAAWALEALALAEGGRLAPRVRGLVREWVRGSNVQLEAAGVAAYGTFLGAEYPTEALKSMREVVAGRLLGAGGRDRVERAERELANIVRAATLEMFVAGAQNQVVAELAEWTRMPMWRLRRCSARCLVGLAKREGGQPGWPVLLELADGRDSFRANVSVLWCNALAAENDPAAAWDALHRLILRAENAGQQWPAAAGMMTRAELSDEAVRFRELVRRLLTDIASGDRPADRERLRSLRFHIRLWEFRDRRRLALVPDWMRRVSVPGFTKG